jgi:hypothetical protein
MTQSRYLGRPFWIWVSRQASYERLHNVFGEVPLRFSRLEPNAEVRRVVQQELEDAMTQDVGGNIILNAGSLVKYKARNVVRKEVETVVRKEVWMEVVDEMWVLVENMEWVEVRDELRELFSEEA